MNLYRILLKHFSPKDSELGIVTYVYAQNDESIYNWIKTEPFINNKTLYNNWADEEIYNEDHMIYDYDLEIEETFKDRKIRLKGDINDDQIELNDLYYGKTLYGWELLKENISNDFESDYNELFNLNILIKI